jgi:hypothetical protein
MLVAKVQQWCMVKLNTIKLITIVTVSLTPIATNPIPAAAAPYLTMGRAEARLAQFDEEQIKGPNGPSNYTSAYFEKCHRVTRSRIRCWEISTANFGPQEMECTNWVDVWLDRHNHTHLSFFGGGCEPSAKPG